MNGKLGIDTRKGVGRTMSRAFYKKLFSYIFISEISKSKKSRQISQEIERTLKAIEEGLREF